MGSVNKIVLKTNYNQEFSHVPRSLFSLEAVGSAN